MAGAFKAWRCEVKILFVIAALRNGGAERVLNVLANELCKDNEITIALL